MVDLNHEDEFVDTGNDAIVIIKYIEGITGGRSLDMTGFPLKVIQGGHIVIKKGGVYKPMPIEGKVYAALPAGYAIAGVVVTSKLATEAMVGIMTRGSVNQIASPFPVTDAIKTALSLINFTQD